MFGIIWLSSARRNKTVTSEFLTRNVGGLLIKPRKRKEYNKILNLEDQKLSASNGGTSQICEFINRANYF
jgi:hypothetical protein